MTAHQNQMAALGNDFAFEVARIEDSIKIRAVLHMNQDDPRFGGHGNPNLSGEATSRSGNRIRVEAEARYTVSSLMGYRRHAADEALPRTASPIKSLEVFVLPLEVPNQTQSPAALLGGPAVPPHERDCGPSR